MHAFLHPIDQVCSLVCVRCPVAHRHISELLLTHVCNAWNFPIPAIRFTPYINSLLPLTPSNNGLLVWPSSNDGLLSLTPSNDGQLSLPPSSGGLFPSPGGLLLSPEPSVPRSMLQVANGLMRERPGRAARHTTASPYHRPAPYPLMPTPSQSWKQDSDYYNSNSGEPGDDRSYYCYVDNVQHSSVGGGQGSSYFGNQAAATAAYASEPCLPQMNFGAFSMPQASVSANFFNSWAAYNDDQFSGAQRRVTCASRYRYTNY